MKKILTVFTMLVLSCGFVAAQTPRATGALAWKRPAVVQRTATVVGDTITINAEDGFANCRNYEDRGYFYITIKESGYMIHLAPKGSTLGGHYTLDDCLPEDCNVKYGDETEEFTELEFDFTGDYYDANRGYDLTATGKTASGRVYRILVHKQGLYTETDVDIHVGDGFDHCEHMEKYNDWYIYFSDGQRLVHLDLVGDQLGGHYTLDNALADYCLVTRDGEKDYIAQLDVDFTGEVGNPTTGYALVGTAVGKSGTTYHLDVRRDPDVVPTDTTTILCDVVKYIPDSYDYDGTRYELRDQASNLTLGFVLEHPLGDYTYPLHGLKRGSITTDAGEVAVDHGSVSALYANDAILLTGLLVGKDAQAYKFQARYNVEAKGTQQLEFTDMKVARSMTGFYLYGTDDEWSVTASINVHDFELTPRTLAPNDCFVSMLHGSDQVYSSLVEQAQLVAESDGSVGLRATFYATDQQKYTLHILWKLPESKGTKTYTFDHLDYNNMLASGAQQLYGYSADSTLAVSLGISTRQVEGQFSMADGNVVGDYTYLAFFDTPGDEQPSQVLTFLDGTVDITLSTDSIVTAHCLLLGRDAYTYDFTLKAKYKDAPIAHIDYDVEDEDVDVDYSADDNAKINFYPVDGIVQVQLANSTRGDLFAMLMYVEGGDGAHIPEGTYAINSTYTAPSVQAGTLGDDGLYPTVYGLTNADGVIQVPLWFLVEGTVTVKYVEDALTFQVDARNSYGRTVRIRYADTAAAIHEVKITTDTATRKYLRKGQLVIDHAGQRYNVAGQCLR